MVAINNIEGRAALAEAMGIGLTETFAATSHHITNPMVTIDGDEATLIDVDALDWLACDLCGEVAVFVEVHNGESGDRVRHLGVPYVRGR